MKNNNKYQLKNITKIRYGNQRSNQTRNPELFSAKSCIDHSTDSI